MAFGLGLFFEIGFFQNGIFLQLLLNQIDELELIQLQQFDRLLQLGSHHQLLRKSELLFQFERHEILCIQPPPDDAIRPDRPFLRVPAARSLET